MKPTVAALAASLALLLGACAKDDTMMKDDMMQKDSMKKDEMMKK